MRKTITPEEATEIIREHFANLTREEFLANLHRVCPELFEEEQPCPSNKARANGRKTSKTVGRKPRTVNLQAR